MAPVPTHGRNDELATSRPDRPLGADDRRRCWRFFARDRVRTMSPVASYQDLGVYLDRWLFRGVTFDISPGEFVAITGPRGVGKSTLANVCGGIRRPTEGTGTFPLDRAFTVATKHDPTAEGSAALLDSPPSLVIADDPAAAITGDAQTVIKAQVLAYCDDGAAVICATHDEDLIAVADRVVNILEYAHV